MIVEFSVRNFGAIKEWQTLSFVADKDSYLEESYVIKRGRHRLLKFMLLYGSNASGKSTVLQALDYLRTIVLVASEDKNKRLEFQPYLLDEGSRSDDTQMEIEFLVDEELYKYSITFNTTFIVREELKKSSGGRPKVIFKRESDREKRLTTILFNKEVFVKESEAQLMTGNTLWNSSAISGYLKTNIFVEELQSVVQWFMGYLNKLILPKADLTQYVTEGINEGRINKGFVLSMLRRADFNISDIIIDKSSVDLPDGLMRFLMTDSNLPDDVKQKLSEGERQMQRIDMKFEHKNELGESCELPYRVESLGTHRYYGLAGILSLMRSNPAAYPIDELEASLHPDLFRHFILLFLRNIKGSQCIATTHNREILGDKSLFRNDAIWITDKQGGCDTKLYSLAHFDSSVIRNTTSVLNAYKAGRLGGTPDLGDIYIDEEL
ncbi:MAG: ATP-binding protein [Rikenellaceae bacterium]